MPSHLIGRLLSCLALALFVSLALPAAESEPQIRGGLLFDTADGVDLKIDVAIPPGPGPFPAVLCIHGGAWAIGDRHMWALGDRSGRTSLIRDLALRGYVAATADYRLAPKHPFPAQVEDVKTAVRYLRAHAAEFHLDPLHVAALGESSGGHLSLMLAFTTPADGLEGTHGDLTQSTAVQAVVNFYGPSDFTTWSEAATPMQLQLLTNFLGTTDPTSPLVRRASPLTYLRAGAPPVMTVHGSLDSIVPVSQSVRLHEALRVAGVRERLVLFPGCDHVMFGKDPITAWHTGMDFLDEVFKRPAAAGLPTPATH